MGLRRGVRGRKAIVGVVDINREMSCQTRLTSTLPNLVLAQEWPIDQPVVQTTPGSGTVLMDEDDQAMRET